ncbi:NADH-quinone oxidoreductase subunit C [Chloroflexota bacterium]
MTVVLAGKDIASKIEEKFPGCIAAAEGDYILVNSDSLLNIAAFLKETPEFGFNYLSFITAVDYYDYFELVYRLESTEHNHSLTMKTRCHDRENPAVPSVVGLWLGADFQEREIFDLMGINFEGHPNMKRIFLWEGYQGHPLRKDFLQ